MGAWCCIVREGVVLLVLVRLGLLVVFAAAAPVVA
jgi:hypothetical protein